MKRYTTISSYTDKDGTLREIAIDVDRGGRFRVLDVAPDETLLVALLRGYDDDAERALSCAADYAQQIREYLAGERDDMPCPHPLGRHPQTITVGGHSAANTPAAQDQQSSLVPAA